MRDLKFRVWDKENNKYFVPTYEAYEGNLEYLTLHPKGDLLMKTKNKSIHESCFPNRFIVQLYTGLKDKNDKEIYEGDILKRTVSVHVLGSGRPPKDVDEYLKVEYKDEYAGFCIGETHLFAYVGAKYDVHTGCRCTDVEVVGNIYESPELLEESK